METTRKEYITPAIRVRVIARTPMLSGSEQVKAITFGDDITNGTTEAKRASFFSFIGSFDDSSDEDY